MVNSTILEIAIGLVVIYLVLGLIVTSANEFLAQLLGLRAENLSDAIYGLFPGEDRFRLGEDILNHPLINSLSRKQLGIHSSGAGSGVGREVTKLPSAIPGETFAKVLLELQDQPSVNTPYDEKTLGPVKTALRGAGSSRKAKAAAIAAWFEDAVDRSHGWYKRRVQVMSFMVAFAFVVLLNADTLTIVERLSSSPADRARLEAYGERLKKSETPEDIPPEIRNATLDFLGWAPRESQDPRRAPSAPSEFILKLLGLSISSFAICLGAPFWFDLLSKFMTVRTGGLIKKNEPAEDPDSKKPDGSKPVSKSPSTGGG